MLIFDECTSGFRQSFGGLHKIYGVEPDMAVFGKALGNGYAITAVIGREEVMQAAQGSFISSTFWTERIGPTAALATLKLMEEVRSWETITERGEKIRKRWDSLGKKYGLELSFFGLPALTGFGIKSEKALHYRTYLTQEMLKRGILASGVIYVTLPHTDEVINKYFTELESVFEVIAACERGEKSIDELLEGPLSHSTFKRLN